MSRSRPYSSSHSRGGRPPRSTTIAVTEANFAALQLEESAGSQHPSVTPGYSTPSHTYTRDPYRQPESSTGFLNPGFDPTEFIQIPSSGGYIGSQPTGPSFPGLDHDSWDSFPDQYRPDMSYQYSRNTVTGNYESQGSYPSRSPSIPEYQYSSSRDTSQRSTSYPSGPHILPSSVTSGFTEEGQDIARQRRRRIHLSRRQSKARVRRTRLPSVPENETSLEESVDHPVDFLAAPSTSQYEIGGAHQYSRTSSTSTPYLTPTSSNPYTYPGYPVGSINPQPTYSSPQNRPPSNITAGGSYSTIRHPGSSVSPNPDEPIRVVENPRRPQCFEHGCNGRQFSTFSNLLRHQREKSGLASKSKCPRCGAEFTRTTARNGHMAHEKCKPRPQD